MDNRGFYDSALEGELQKNGVYASVTKGVSMRPLFKTNRDMVIIKKPTEELHPFDVALYRLPSGQYVLHRVIKVLKDKYVIRGDNTYSLEYVPKEWVIGVLTEFNRKGKRISVENKGYLLYARLWNFIYPVRYLYVKARSLAGRVYRKILKRK